MTDHDHMQRARELLAAEWRKDGFDDIAMSLQQPDLVTAKNPAIRAIAAALRSQGAQAAQVSDVTRQLIERDHRGAAKYGTTLDRTDLSLPDWLQHMAEELMDAAGYALAAKRTAEAAQAVPDGWQLVPVELTDKMMDAAEGCHDDWPATTWAKAWAAMLAAAPKPEGR